MSSVQVFKPLEKMTDPELESRVAWHRDLAALYERQSMPNAANSFRSLSGVYQKELERRVKPPVVDDSWEDPDR